MASGSNKQAALIERPMRGAACFSLWLCRPSSPLSRLGLFFVNEPLEASLGSGLWSSSESVGSRLGFGCIPPDPSPPLPFHTVALQQGRVGGKSSTRSSPIAEKVGMF